MPDINPYLVAFIIILFGFAFIGTARGIVQFFHNPSLILQRRHSEEEQRDAKLIGAVFAFIIVVNLVLVLIGRWDWTGPVNTVLTGWFSATILSRIIFSSVHSLGMGTLISTVVTVIVGWVANKAGIFDEFAGANQLWYWVLGVVFGVVSILFVHRANKTVT